MIMLLHIENIKKICCTWDIAKRQIRFSIHTFENALWFIEKN